MQIQQIVTYERGDFSSFIYMKKEGESKFNGLIFVFNYLQMGISPSLLKMPVVLGLNDSTSSYFVSNAHMYKVLCQN